MQTAIRRESADSVGLGWGSIVRLGFVQMAIGAIVVLMTSTLNRVMTVEYHTAVAVPAGLVAFHYVVQLARARWGHGSDGGRRTPWIMGGMAVLATGAVLAAWATTRIGDARGLAAAIIAFAMIGGGVGAAGTSLLALLAARTAPARRPAAAAMTWIMMIIGFVLASGVAGHYLDPFSPARLVAVVAGIAAVALALAVLGVAGIESRDTAMAGATPRPPFAEALREITADARARRFTLFIAVSMVAYSAQELILEPMAGLLFGYTPGQSTSLAALQHGAALAGMVAVGVGARGGGRWLRRATIAGCLGSAAALMALALTAAGVPGVSLRPAVALLGFTNGVFAVGAVGSMMTLAGSGAAGREGIRMGVWGAAQAIAFAVGGFAGAVGIDVGRRVLGATAPAFVLVFAVEAALFVVAAVIALGVGRLLRTTSTPALVKG